MPESVIAAPPAAAPASPAPAAPAPSSPAASPAATTPATPAAPNSPGAAPAAAAPSGPQPPAKLNPREYQNASDAYMAETAWRQQLEEFKQQNPDVKIEDDSPWPQEAKPAEQMADGTAPEAEAKPAEEQPKSEGEAKPEETPEPFTMEDEPSLTPQALNDLIKNDAGLKAALDANPAAKNQLFKMAREHAELVQFKGIFPTADAAKFAQQTANRTVSLRTKFQMADSPEGMASAFDDFMQEFAVIGPDGKQVMDEHGEPVYGDDLYAFGEHVVDRYVDSSLADVEARLQANQYRSEDEKERDSDMRIALQILKGDLHPDSGKNEPDFSNLPDEVRSDLQKRLDEVKAREAALEAKTGNRATREAARKEGNQKFIQETTRRTFDQVNQTVDALRKAGATIPDWMLKTTAPGTNLPIFYSEVGKAIDQLIASDPYTRNNFIQLEMQPPTPENLQARVELYDRLLQQQNERGVSNLRAIVTRIVRSYGKDLQGAKGTSEIAPTQSREPQQGSAPRPQVLTKDEAWKQAENFLAKNVQGWDNMSPSERMAYTLTKQNELLAGGRR